MKVTYMIQIGWHGWHHPCRILSFERETTIKPDILDGLLVTNKTIATPRSVLHNLLADEYLVTLNAISEPNEEKALCVVKEFLDSGWEERAVWLDKKWHYLGQKWYLPESLEAKNEEVIREDAKATGQETDRPGSQMATPGERPATEAG